MAAARRHGTVVSYDLNYRPSLWEAIGGKTRAQEVNRRLAPLADVMLGNEEDFTAALGFEVPGLGPKWQDWISMLRAPVWTCRSWIRRHSDA